MSKRCRQRTGHDRWAGGQHSSAFCCPFRRLRHHAWAPNPCLPPHPGVRNFSGSIPAGRAYPGEAPLLLLLPLLLSAPPLLLLPAAADACCDCWDAAPAAARAWAAGVCWNQTPPGHKEAWI